MNNNIKKLNIDENFKKKLESLYKKNISIKQPNKIQNKKVSNIKHTIQPQQNVFLENNLEKIYEIDKKDSNRITITLEIFSYYQLLSYIFFSIFSVCLSLRIMYILFLV